MVIKKVLKYLTELKLINAAQKCVMLTMWFHGSLTASSQSGMPQIRKHSTPPHTQSGMPHTRKHCSKPP